MAFDRKTQLSLALIHLLAKKQHGSVLASTKLCDLLCISESYLQQISKPLCNSNLITSRRGPNGGYSLAKHSEQISVADVIKVVRDFSQIPYPSLTLEQSLWNNIDKKILDLLEKITINNISTSDTLNNHKAKVGASHFNQLII